MSGIPSSSQIPESYGITNATDVISIFADISKPTYTDRPRTSIGSSFTSQAFQAAMFM